MTNSMDLTQALILLFGSGILAQLLRVTYSQGKDSTKIEAMWLVHQENIRLSLQRRELADKNSPWSIKGIGEWIKAHGGADYSMREPFVKLLEKKLPGHDLELHAKIQQTFGLDHISTRVNRANEHLQPGEEPMTLWEYLEILCMLLRKAEREGMPALCAELGLDSQGGS